MAPWHIVVVGLKVTDRITREASLCNHLNFQSGQIVSARTELLFFKRSSLIVVKSILSETPKLYKVLLPSCGGLKQIIVQDRNSVRRRFEQADIQNTSFDWRFV